MDEFDPERVIETWRRKYDARQSTVKKALSLMHEAEQGLWNSWDDDGEAEPLTQEQLDRCRILLRRAMETLRSMPL